MHSFLSRWVVDGHEDGVVVAKARGLQPGEGLDAAAGGDPIGGPDF